MTLVSTTGQEIASLFDRNVQDKIVTIHTAIPGSLTMFLDKKEVVKRIQFRKDFEASQVLMGTAKKVNFDDFQHTFRKTIKEGFDYHGVTEVRPEDLSQDLRQKYEQEVISRPDKGKAVTIILRLKQPYQKKEGALWTAVNAHIYLYLTEECENNWFKEDKRKFSYEMTVELNGLSLNKDKAIRFCQVLAESSPEKAIKQIRELYPLSLDDI